MSRKEGKASGAGARTNKNKSRFQLLIYTFVFIITFGLVFSIAIGGILLSAYWENIRANFTVEKWTYTVGLPEDEDYSVSVVSSKNIYVDGVLYLNMSDIASMCELTVVGDFNSLTYFPYESSDQTATFYYNSDKLTVNGVHYKLNGQMFERDGNIYVPASFVHQFCTGIRVEVDDDAKTIEMYRHSLGMEYDPLDKPYHVYEDVYFLTGSIQPINMPDRGLMFSNQNNGSGIDEQ